MNDKLDQFRRSAIRVRDHDDDSSDTYDALFLAGHLAPDVWQEYESLLKRVSAMTSAFDKARFYWYGLQLDARQAALFQQGIEILQDAIAIDA